MMKAFWGIILLFLAAGASAQTSFLKEAAAKLDKALVAKDTVVLKQLLHKDLTYGHSNGWVQSRADVLRDLSAGKMQYISINNKDSKWTVTNDVATLRSHAAVRYALEGKESDINLHVVQVWLKTGKGWQLLSRQGVRLNPQIP